MQAQQAGARFHYASCTRDDDYYFPLAASPPSRPCARLGRARCRRGCDIDKDPRRVATRSRMRGSDQQCFPSSSLAASELVI